MTAERKRIAAWFITIAAVATLVTALSSCTGMQRLGTPEDIFATAAAGYEVVQVTIEGAVYSGQLTDLQKAKLKGIDRVAMDALQTGRAALRAKDAVQLNYSTKLLQSATTEARLILGTDSPTGDSPGAAVTP